MIALVITIVVLLILAGVSIATLTGENGVLTQAETAKLATELSQYKEELEVFKLGKIAENKEFSETTLVAGQNTLVYNTQETGEIGNIKNAIPSISDEFFEMLEIIKGELLINTQDENIIKVAQGLGIQVNPYDIEDGVLLSSNGNLLLMDDDGIVTIPDGVTAIGEGAFANLNGLKTIVIPGTVKEIRKNAFAYNTTLENVIIQEGVESIGERAFHYCTNLKSINMPESLTQIGKSAFYVCLKLTSIEIPSKITKLDDMAFSSCISLNKVTFRGDSLQTIEEEVFWNCAFDSFEITTNVINIDATAFTKCSNLINIEVNDNFVYESGMLLASDRKTVVFVSTKYYNNNTELVIPNGVENFYTDISGLTKLKKITLPSSVTNIYPRLFSTSIEEVEIDENNTKYKTLENCIYTTDDKELVLCYSKEKKVTLTNNVEQINSYAFSIATDLEELTLADSTRILSEYCLNGTTKLKRLNIGKDTSDISGYFLLSNYNVEVTIDSENPNFIVENNIIYSKNKEKLVRVLYKIQGKFVIEDSVKVIGGAAFVNQDEMTQIDLSTNLETIRGGAFYGCSQLVNIEIPSTVTSIDTNCFFGCNNLDTIKINKPAGSISGAPWGAPKGDKVLVWNE